MTIISPSCADLQVNSFAGVDFNTAGCTWEQLTHATEMMRTTRCSVTIPLSPGQLSINCWLVRLADQFTSSHRGGRSTIAAVHRDGWIAITQTRRKISAAF